jgi:hypothetical protein
MLPQPNNIDFEYLVRFCRENFIARVYMELFSRRKRNSNVSMETLSRNNGYNFKAYEIRACCKAFKKAKCGNYVKSASQQESQWAYGSFKFLYDPIEIGKAVVERLNNI